MLPLYILVSTMCYLPCTSYCSVPSESCIQQARFSESSATVKGETAYQVVHPISCEHIWKRIILNGEITGIFICRKCHTIYKTKEEEEFNPAIKEEWR